MRRQRLTLPTPRTSPERSTVGQLWGHLSNPVRTGCRRSADLSHWDAELLINPVASQGCQEALTISVKPEHDGESDWVHPRAASDLVLTIGCAGMQPMSQASMTDVQKQSLRPLAGLAAWLTV
jgi:hypothetical protein